MRPFTDFYLQRHNPKTKRCKDLFICRLSASWAPSMLGYKIGLNLSEPLLDSIPEIKSWTDWKLFLLAELSRGSLIFSDEDEPFTFEEFVRKIEQHQKNYQDLEKNFAEYMIKKIQEEINHPSEIDFSANTTTLNPSPRELDYFWVDSNGYSFYAGKLV